MSMRWWQARRCNYCRRPLEPPTSHGRCAATRDHVHPKSRGGTTKVPCCRQCNGLKADFTQTEWELFMRTYPAWWKDQQFRYSVPFKVRRIIRVAVA